MDDGKGIIGSGKGRNGQGEQEKENKKEGQQFSIMFFNRKAPPKDLRYDLEDRRYRQS